MSTPVAQLSGAPSQIGELWEEAKRQYEANVGPLTELSIVGNVATVQTILDEVGKKAATFKQSRDDGSKTHRLKNALRRCLPVVHILSEIGAQASKAAFAPSEAIFVAIRHLITTANSVTGDYDKLCDFFEDVDSYLQGLASWNTKLPKAELEAAVIDVLGSVLVLCGLYTKYINQKRLVKALKTLVSGEDSELKRAYQHFQRAVKHQAQIVQHAILSNTEQLRADVGNVNASFSHILGSTRRIENNMVQMAQRTNCLMSNITDQKRNTLLTWLSTLDVTTQQQDIFAKHHEGTGQWVVTSSEFQNWVHGDQASTLWCSGDPGTGKSVIMAISVNHVEENTPPSTTAISFFYFSYKDSRTHILSEVWSSIIRQLVEQTLIIPLEVEAFHTKFVGMRSMRPSTKDYISLIKTISQTFKRTYLFIDALDELPERHRDEFLHWVNELEPFVRLFITGRRSVVLNENDYKIARLDIVARKEDVRVYLESRLDMCGKRLAPALKAEPNLREEIIKKLLEQANGMFLLAHLQMEHVCYQRNKSEVRKALSSLAKDVDDFYSDSFERIEQMNEADREIALKVLAYIFHACKQLSFNELCHALATRKGDRDLDRDALDTKEYLQGILHGLIRIDDASNLVGLSHLTLHEFLQSHHDRLPPECEKDLSSTCLAYLSFDTFATGICKTAEDLSKRLEDYYFLEYASQYWATHAVSYMDELMNEMLVFLNDVGKLATSVQMLYLPRRHMDKRHDQYPRHFTSLHAAAYWGLGKVLSKLKCSPEDINRKDSYGMTALLLSAQFGHDSVVEQLLHMKAELNDQSNRGETALSLAARQGHTTTVALLLHQGANRIMEDDEGWTALHWAIVGGHTGAVKLLLTEVGNDVESDKSGHDKALILAAEKGNDAMVRMLLAEGASVNYKDDQGSTPLDWSVPMGHETTTRILLDNGADPNSTDSYGNVSLHWSIANRVMAHMLVTCGAEIDKKNSQGQSALVWSTLADQVDVVETLTDLGADVNARDNFGCTALHAAALRGNETNVRILLKHKADPNIRDKDGWTPLHAAMVNSHGHVSDILEGLTANGEGIVGQVTDWIANEDMTALVAEMADRKSTGSSVVSGLRSAVNSGYQLRLMALLEQGDDINAIDKIGGCTALTHAAWMGQENTVQLLLDHGAAIDVRDRSGRSALHWASEGGYPDMVTILVDRGANIEMKLFGWTPLLLGARRWNPSVVERLIRSGASLSARDFHGRSVLHWCCKHGDKYMTEVVLRAGTDVDARDHYDQTAIHYATASGQPGIVRLLLKYGADPSQQALDGSTALHMAAYIGQLDVAVVLFNDKRRKQRRQAGTTTVIVPTALDREGFTAQLVAELTNNLQFVRLLRREETESPDQESCDAVPVHHLPVNYNGLREALQAKPPLRLPHDDKCDYTIHGEGMNSLGLPIFSKEVWRWLHEQSELHQRDTVTSSVTVKLEKLSLESPRGQ